MAEKVGTKSAASLQQLLSNPSPPPNSEAERGFVAPLESQLFKILKKDFSN